MAQPVGVDEEKTGVQGMKKSGYLARHEAVQQALLDAMQRTMRQYALDTLLITAHEDLGFGYGRCLNLAEKWSETFESFFPALGASDEADVYQAKLDKKLLDIMGGVREFHNFPDRYPDVKRLGYGGRQG